MNRKGRAPHFAGLFFYPVKTTICYISFPLKLFRNIYGLDVRSINLFRVALGVVMIGQIVGYVLLNFKSMFSPETGVLGNGFATEYIATYTGPEWLFAIDSDTGMLAFIAIRILFLILFAIGAFPRVAALGSAVLLWLFQIRYNVLFLGWEMFAAVLISFSVFLPWNRKPTEKEMEWRSPLAFVTLFQIGFIYFYNGISKNGDKWMDGTAVRFFLAEFDKARPLAHSVIQIDWLTTFLTYYTLVMEVGVLLLLFAPFRSRKLRYISAFLILTLHWGIDLMVDVGFFKWYATCIAILLLPDSFWLKVPASFLRIITPIRVIPMPKANWVRYTGWVLAGYILFMIVDTNLYQTVTSKTNDRVGIVLNKMKLGGSIKAMTPDWWPQYSFMRQFWHLYSPDPPTEKGYMQFEFVTEDKVYRVSEGEPLAEGQLYCNLPEQHLMMYLTLRRVRNKREQIALKAKLMYELRRWNEHKTNPPLKSVEIVIYSFRPNSVEQISDPIYTRTVVQTIDINYGNS